VTGAQRVELALPDRDQRITAKWKPAPHRLDAFNNSPRREIAAYEIQKLFLDPDDYVVPTTRLRCLDPRELADPLRNREANAGGASCRLGVLSLWLEDVRLPDHLLDENRFVADREYARRLADFNLALYLMSHADGRRGNFLEARAGQAPRFFSVDNGVAFGGFVYNWFVPNWKKLRVPALRGESIDRLRALEERDLDVFGVVAQLERIDRRHVVDVTQTANLDPEDGVRVDGRTIQLGLEKEEIENLWERIEHLIQEVDRGRISVFRSEPRR
jgi:hypothetical protein